MDTRTPIGPAANTPGEILRTEFLEPLGLSQNELATKTGLARMRISEIVRGQRAITAETAIALGKVFATGPRFWMNLQADYDLAIQAKKSRPWAVVERVRQTFETSEGGVRYPVVHAKTVVHAKKKARGETISSGKAAPAHKPRSASGPIKRRK